jgi:hypothetical protein
MPASVENGESSGCSGRKWADFCPAMSWLTRYGKWKQNAKNCGLRQDFETMIGISLQFAKN